MIPFTLKNSTTSKQSHDPVLTVVAAHRSDGPGRTGMRWGEATALRWEDFDWDRRQARVMRARACSRDGVKRTKTQGSVRAVDLSAELVEALQAHRAAQRRKTPWVFVTKKGRLVALRPLPGDLEAAAQDGGTEVPEPAQSAAHVRVHPALRWESRSCT